MAMTITMGAVWDRTVMVLQGRGGMLARIAALALFLPAVVRAAAQAYADPASPGSAAVAGLIAIAAVVATAWGQLALIAAASDPAVMGDEAGRMATRRLPVAIGLALIVLAVVTLVFAPMAVVMMRAGLNMPAMASGGGAAVPPRIAGFVGVYTIVFLIAALVIGARLVLLYPVILLERNGIGAYARSFRLTRGLTLRILGVLVLYVLVLLVASTAARLVVGTIAALALGPGATATFIAAIATALVAAALGTVAVVFSAQLYLTVTDARAIP